MLGNRYIDDYLYYVNAEIYALMVAVLCCMGRCRTSEFLFALGNFKQNSSTCC